MPLEEIVRRLKAGDIVALKGSGGFLLACDARNERSVQLLRERKQRDAKPFACIVSSLASARRLAVLSVLIIMSVFRVRSPASPVAKGHPPRARYSSSARFAACFPRKSAMALFIASSART